ncbi:MAG: ABC transporter permease [Candidatus Dadabacteria bacterium]|nr:ABC transporter permease [Candidatus Dadabacteria bacterium]NIS08960.1 ABC transporter permease [Candidatus Dadabacteria bacterium]NIV40774.1 ABC transporter permease subunit [Candidatus Dadabacteria bacterium]NIY22267.1 ABC transporter permease subunit [Candidatus Dadabacteria bacterium]
MLLLKIQLIISSAIIAAILCIAIFAPAISPYSYDKTDFSRILQSPSKTHPMGTDQEGRDLLSRVIYGARVSMIIAIGTALLALFIGTAYGGLSGYLGGKIDELLMRVVDVFYSLPDLLLIVLVMLILGQSLFGIILALSVTGWMRVARVVRGSVLQVKNYDYVASAKSLGASPLRVFFRHIFPNILSPLIITLTFSVPYAILAESTLSFLGLGIRPPESSWGTLASTGWQGMRTFPHLIVFPSIAIFVTAFSFNMLGESLRDYFDPKSEA